MIRLSDTAKLYHEDCREALKHIPSDSLDSCCTDPPYALVSVVKRFGSPTAAPAKGNDAYMRASAGFMSRTWDTGEVAFDPEFWREVYRVLKPGAHVAAFGGTRSQHRLVCAIEDAGFEIRDQLYWHYGSGFPKSQNVSAFIDKELGAERALPNVEPMQKKGEVGEISKNVRCTVCGKARASGNPCVCPRPEDVAVTPEAAEWNGFGTALKPATEPICLARKPLSESTVAKNVLKWRTGALNIGACRVPTHERLQGSTVENDIRGGRFASGHKNGGERNFQQAEGGRWPANVVTDGSAEVVGMFPVTSSGVPTAGDRNGDVYGKFGKRSLTNHGASSGSAARFFYSAKASKADRNGSKHPTVKPIALMEWLATLITPPGGTILDPFAGSGTTGAAASNKGFSVVLCEREAEYVADIKARFSGSSRLVIDLAAVRREIEIEREIVAFQARMAARA